MFKINSKKGYIIHKTCNRVLLCKVLNEYSSDEEATKALTELLVNKTTEKKLLKDYVNKPI